MRRVLLAVVPLAFAVMLPAQELPSRIAPGQRVRITAPSAHLDEAVAVVDSLSPHFLTLSLERYVGRTRIDTLHVTVADSALRKVEVSRGQVGHAGAGAMIGAVIGGTAGMIAVGIACGGATSMCNALPPVAGAVFALPGAAIGTLIGAVMRTDRWESVSLFRLRLTVGAGSDGRLGVAGSVGF